EAVFPALAMALEPALRERERLARELHVPHAPGLRGADEPARLEQLHVLADRGERHGERGAELGHRPGADDEALHDRATGRVGERVEDLVEGRLMKHLLQYLAAPNNSQGVTSVFRSDHRRRDPRLAHAACGDTRAHMSSGKPDSSARVALVAALSVAMLGL